MSYKNRIDTDGYKSWVFSGGYKAQMFFRTPRVYKGDYKFQVMLGVKHR